MSLKVVGKIRIMVYRSPLLDFTSRIYGVVRVYTEREYVEKVRRVAENNFASR